MTVDGHKVTVRSRAVALAAGAIHTPAIMIRSGMGGQVGKNLMLHPVLITWGVFDEEVRPWEGTLGATFSDEFLDMGEGYGIKYEHAATPPSILAIFAPWRGSRRVGGADAVASLHRGLRSAAASPRRRRGGGRRGRPADAALGAVRLRPRRDAAAGLDGAAQILEAGGARRIYSSHAGWVSYEPGRNGGRESLLEAADRCGWGAGQVTLGVVPPDGHGPHGLRRATISVCNSDGEAWDVKGLYVVDGAVLPTGLGVNPMVTIEAAAHKIAAGWQRS